MAAMAAMTLTVPDLLRQLAEAIEERDLARQEARFHETRAERFEAQAAQAAHGATSPDWQRMRDIPWLDEFFPCRGLNFYACLGEELNRTSRELGLEVRHLLTPEGVGKVNYYHVDAIAALKARLEQGQPLLRHFRRSGAAAAGGAA